VIGKRIRNGHLEYLVKWEKRKDKPISWVQIRNLKNIMDLIADFEYKVLFYGPKILVNKAKHLVRDIEVELSDCNSTIEYKKEERKIVKYSSYYDSPTVIKF
jgi:hypothetical protein